MKRSIHMRHGCAQRAFVALLSFSLLLQPIAVLALAPSSGMKEVSEDAQRRMQAMECIKAFLGTVRSGDKVGPKADAPLKNEHIEILSGLAMILDPQEVERGLRSISFGNIERTAERLEKIGWINAETFLDKVLLPQITVEAFSKAFGDKPDYWAESLEILYFNSRRLPWMFQLLGADAVAAAIAGNTLRANGAMRELLPFGSLKEVENVADTLGMARSEFATLFARDPKRLSQIALSLSHLSSAQKKALFDVFPRTSYVQAMLQNRKEFQAFLDAMRGMKANQFAALMADAKERDADLQQKFENNPDTFLLTYAGTPLHAWAAAHEESQAMQGRRSYRDAFKGVDPRALVKEALIEKKRRFQVLEERNEFDIASTEMGDLIDRDDDDTIAKCTALVGGARHVVDWDSHYPYKRTMERIRFVAIEGFPLDAWYDEGSLSGGFPTIYVSWDMMRAYMGRIKDDDAQELDLKKVEDDPGLDLAKEELADIFYRLVTEHSLTRDIHVQEDLSPEEAANKARALVDNYGDAHQPFFNEEKRNKMMQARERITRVLDGMDKEAALKTALAELPLQSQEIPPGVPAPEIIQQFRDMQAGGGQRTPRDYSTTASGNDLEMTYAEHEAVIDPFVQRAAQKGKIMYLSPRSPPAREILAFLQWLGERSGRAELSSLFETLLITPKENSPTQVKLVYASSTNPLPVFKGETIVGHAGDHGIYAFIGDANDERLATQHLVHEFGARLQMTHGEFNEVLEQAFVAWRRDEASDQAMGRLMALLRKDTNPFRIAATLPKANTGLTERDFAARKLWTREKILEALRERKKTGKPLDFKTVRTQAGGLYQAASTHLKDEGGYAGALKAIGKTDAEVDKLRGLRFWTKDKIIEAIRQRERDKKSLNSFDVQKDDGGMFMTALKLFKKPGKKKRSWDDVLRGVGKTEEEIARIRVRRAPWTRNSVIEEIRKREASGAPLNSRAVQAEESGLLDAAINIFKGGWEGTLKAAGKTGEEIASIRLIREWSREKVIEAIRKRDAEGKNLNVQTVQMDDSGLHHAGRSYFAAEGGWDGALRAAGKTEDQIKAIRWAHDRSRDAILQEIQQRRAQGKALNALAVDSGLYQTASRMFKSEGGWDGALKAAGIPADEIASIRLRESKWTKAKVVEAIQQRVREGKPLNVTSVLEEGESLYRAARRAFRTEGRWEGALRAAGLDPEKIYKVPKSLRERLGHRQKILPQNVTLATPDKFWTRNIRDVFKEWDDRLTALAVEVEEIAKRSSLEIAILDIQRSGKGRKQLELTLNQIPEGIEKGDVVAIEAAGHKTKDLKVQDVWGNKVLVWLGDEVLGEIQAAKLVKTQFSADLRHQMLAVKRVKGLLREAIAKAQSSLDAALWNILLGLEAPPQTKVGDLAAQELAWLDEDIIEDDSQKTAVQMALNEKSTLQIIWGPPGTGKTKVIAEIARQFARRGKRVLIVSQMNQAVDVVLGRIMVDEETIPLLRLGNNPAAITDEFVRDLWVGNPQHRRKSLETFRNHPKNGIIIGATSVGVSVDREFNHFPHPLKEFDLVIMDEASRERWGGASIPFFLAKEKIIVVGDPKQLPPLDDFDVKKVLEGKGFDSKRHYQGMLDDLVDRGFDQVMLSTNYRSHPLIAGLISQSFYENRIGTRDLEEDPIRDDTVKLLDTSKQSAVSHEIKESPDELSNPFEAGLVIVEIKRLLGEGLKPEQITVLTPYSKQVEKIRQELAKSENSLTPDVLEILSKNISTVDSFQGGENRATIVSFVRSNKERPNVGFLKDLRRLNVALSRAQERLIIIGDMDTLKNTRRTPADLEVGRIFTELEKYYEEIVKPSVAAVKATEQPAATKAYLDKYGQAEMNPKIREAFEETGRYQVLDEGVEIGPEWYGAFGMGRLISAKQGQKLKSMNQIILDAKEVLLNDPVYRHKDWVKDMRVVMVEGLPYDMHYGTAGDVRRQTAYIPADIMELLSAMHESGDPVKRENALLQLADILYHEAEEPMQAISLGEKKAHELVSHQDSDQNILSAKLEEDLAHARVEMAEELELRENLVRILPDAAHKMLSPKPLRLHLFGQRLRMLRKARGFTRAKQLADRMGLDENDILRWERGEHKPQERFASRLASELQIPLDLLFYGKPLFEALRETGLTEGEKTNMICYVYGVPWETLKLHVADEKISATKLAQLQGAVDFDLRPFFAEGARIPNGQLTEADIRSELAEIVKLPWEQRLARTVALFLQANPIKEPGVDPDIVRRALEGQRPHPGNLKLLAKALDVPLDILLFARPLEEELFFDPSQGRRVIKARLARGLTQRQLASLAAIGHTRIAYLERNEGSLRDYDWEVLEKRLNVMRHLLQYGAPIVLENGSDLINGGIRGKHPIQVAA